MSSPIPLKKEGFDEASSPGTGPAYGRAVSARVPDRCARAEFDRLSAAVTLVNRGAAGSFVLEVPTAFAPVAPPNHDERWGRQGP